MKYLSMTSSASALLVLVVYHWQVQADLDSRWAYRRYSRVRFAIPCEKFLLRRLPQTRLVHCLTPSRNIRAIETGRRVDFSFQGVAITDG